jgi:hypothetical protein
MVHITGRSWQAAAVSAVQILTVGSALGLLNLANVPAWWLPLGALACGNLLSLAAGIALAGVPLSPPAPELPSFRTLLGRGHWLLLAELIPYGSAFVVSGLVTHLAGAASLGYAEAARVVGQPVLVATAGLSVVLAPRSIVAAQRKSLGEARRISRMFTTWVPALGLVYAVIVGRAWSESPLVSLVPKAYVIPGLVVATVLANIATGSSAPLRFELLGVGRERGLTRVEAVGNGLRVLVACMAGPVGALVVPVGLAVLAGTRWFGCRHLLGRHYASGLPGTVSGQTDRA